METVSQRSTNDAPSHYRMVPAYTSFPIFRLSPSYEPMALALVYYYFDSEMMTSVEATDYRSGDTIF
jgi:hypothetical protein